MRFFLYPFRDKKESLSDFAPFHQNKLQEQEVQDVVNINKIKSEPYDDFVDEAYSKFNETLMKNQDPHSQTENDEIPGVKHSYENDSEDTETVETFAIPNFMPKILPDD